MLLTYMICLKQCKCLFSRPSANGQKTGRKRKMWYFLYSLAVDKAKRCPLTGGSSVLAKCNLLLDQDNVSFCYISWTYYPAADWLEFV